MPSELRQVLRALRRSPTFTATTVTTLALAIGANVAVVSAVETVLFQPVRVPDIGRLVVINKDIPGMGLHGLPETVREATDLFARTDLFSAAGASYPTSMTLTGAGAARRVTGAEIIGAYFGVLETRPALGRLPRAEDSQPGQPPVVVLSDGLWREVAGGDSSIIGRTIELDGARREVIGVLRPGDELPRQARFWVTRPIDSAALADGGDKEDLIARPRPGVPPSQLAAAVSAEGQRWFERYPQEYPPQYRNTMRVVPFVEDLAGTLRPIVLLIFAAVTFALLIACVNVAGVQLVRSIGAANTLAIRSALGASRWRLVRYTLVESLVLAAAGGLCGILLGTLGVAALRNWHIADYPALADVRLDTHVVGYTLGLTALVGCAVAFLPALRTRRVASRTASLGRDRQGVLRGIAVAQVALTLVLLLGSGLMIRSIAAMLRVDTGFSAQNLYSGHIVPTGPRYDSKPARLAFFDGVVARLRAMPGVISAGAAIGIPFAQNGGASSGFSIVGLPPMTQLSPHSLIVPCTPDYFRTMGIGLKAGRLFTDADRDSAPRVAIVDEALANKFLPGVDPIGRQITGQFGPATIVGVVASVGYSRLWRTPYPTSYYPYAQHPIDEMTIVMRTATDVQDPAQFFTAAVSSVEAQVPVWPVASMQQHIDASIESRRVTMIVVSAFAAASLALAILGLYGVLSYSTSVRTHEFGIRMALGANGRAVLGLVIGRGLALVFAGLIVGSLLFLALARLLASFLYGVGPRDPLTFIACAAILTVTATLACWLPARRAAALDPTIALRAE